MKTKHMHRIILAITMLCFLACSSISFAVEGSTSIKKQMVAKKTKKATVKSVPDEKIKAAQEALLNAGFKLKADGLMGKRTKLAIKQYQKKNGLRVTAKLDKATLKKLGVKK